MKFIRPVQSGPSAPRVFVLYKRGAVRFSVVRQNMITAVIREPCVLLQIDVCSCFPGSTKYILPFDIIISYWNMEALKMDCEKSKMFLTLKMFIDLLESV